MAAKRRGYWLEKHRPARHSAVLWWVASFVGLALLGWFFWKSASSRHPQTPLTNAPPSVAQHPQIPAVEERNAPNLPIPVPPPTNSMGDGGSFPRVPPLPVITNTVHVPPVATNIATNKIANIATNTAVPFEKEPTPSSLEENQPRPVKNLFEAQIALARQGISSGSIDGVAGSQTHAALRVFQQKQQLPQTGILDTATKAKLLITGAATTNYTITHADLDRLMTVPKTWLGKSTQTRLDYETILELVAERAHAHPHLIRRMNPSVNWDGDVPAGTTVVIPAVEYPPAKVKASYVRIHLESKVLEAFDSNEHLLAHFPCSIARQVEKRPAGQLHVVVVAQNPNYVFKPEIFPELPEAREIGHKLVLPRGPNNPVGVAWIGLDKSGYGIHGTPKPEEVGRTESHGCFRLANWNAEYLAQLVYIGMPVYVDP